MPGLDDDLECTVKQFHQAGCAPDQATPGLQAACKRILVVEDDPDISQLLEINLKDIAFQPVETDAQEFTVSYWKIDPEAVNLAWEPLPETLTVSAAPSLSWTVIVSVPSV